MVVEVYFRHELQKATSRASKGNKNVKAVHCDVAGRGNETKGVIKDRERQWQKKQQYQ